MSANKPDSRPNQLLPEGRFALLLHNVGRGLSRTDQDHLDWMLEGDNGLLTWSTDLSIYNVGWAPPEHGLPIDTASDIVAMQLPDHRTAYLDYEGPVSDDRGHVKRLLAGVYQIIHTDASTIVLRIQTTTATKADPEQGQEQAIVTSNQILRLQRIRDAGSPDRSNMAWRLSFE